MAADRIPVPSVVANRLTDLGLNADQIWRHAGISPTLMQRPKLILTTSQYFAVWHALEVLSENPLIGLRIGAEARTDQFDSASFAALHSANFGEALQRLARYKRLSCPEEIRIVQSDNQVKITFHWLFAQDEAPAALTDAAFANIQLLLGIGTGKVISPLRVDLARTNNNLQKYEQHFACAVRMGTAQNVLVYPSSTLLEPFSTSNPDLIAALLPGLEIQLDAATPLSIDQQVKSVLREMMRGERPSIAAVARHLYLSPRTLQRRLTDAHTSYQEILDTVRLDIAQKLLTNTDMELGEIAFYLGFDELNSFQRIFHKWQGLTPTQWRAMQSPVLNKNKKI